MGIEKIEIEGFRSLKHVVWEPSNLNVLIGPNGSGKSNILRAIEFLSCGAQGRLEEAIDEAGGVLAVAWNHKRGDLVWRVELSPSLGDWPADPANGMGFSLAQYHLKLKGLGSQGGAIIDREELDLSQRSSLSAGPKEITSFTLISRDLPHVSQVFAAFDGRLTQQEMGSLELALANKAPALSGGAVKVKGAIGGWRCYQNMRTDRDAPIRRAAVSRRMTQVETTGDNLVSVIHTYYQTNPEFKEALDQAMQVGCGEDFAELMTPPAEDGRVQLRLRWRSLSEPQYAFDLSDGLLRFLLLITVLTTPDPPPLIAIDEPETGLHPSMLPIIAECAVEASRKTQVILTTHSPEMLSSFRDTIPKVTVAFWEDGQTVLKTPPDDILKHWLDEYSLGNLMSSGQLEEMAR